MRINADLLICDKNMGFKFKKMLKIASSCVILRWENGYER